MAASAVLPTRRPPAIPQSPANSPSAPPLPCHTTRFCRTGLPACPLDNCLSPRLRRLFLRERHVFFVRALEVLDVAVVEVPDAGGHFVDQIEIGRAHV